MVLDLADIRLSDVTRDVVPDDLIRLEESDGILPDGYRYPHHYE